MLPFVDKKFVVKSPGALVNNGSLTCNVIDTQGFRLCRIVLHLGATDIALTALKIQESDVKASATALTGGADITGTVFGTDKNDAGTTSVLPSATDDDKYFTFEIDLRGRKRYLLPVVTIGNGSVGAYTAITAELWRAENTPVKAADKGVSQNMRLPVL